MSNSTTQLRRICQIWVSLANNRYDNLFKKNNYSLDKKNYNNLMLEFKKNNKDKNINHDLWVFSEYRKGMEEARKDFLNIDPIFHKYCYKNMINFENYKQILQILKNEPYNWEGYAPFEIEAVPDHVKNDSMKLANWFIMIAGKYINEKHAELYISGNK